MREGARYLSKTILKVPRQARLVGLTQETEIGKVPQLATLCALVFSSFDSPGRMVPQFHGVIAMTDFVIHNDLSPPIRLRGHTLLCLQGFRGKGYSPEFVENMSAIHRILTDHPETLVEVLDSPDVVCGACPHRHPIGCTLNGDRSEEELKDQDHVVLRRLGLQVGRRVRWQDVLDRIRASLRSDDLSAICGNCRWLPLGLCREGIERLSHPAKDLPSGAIRDSAQA